MKRRSTAARGSGAVSPVGRVLIAVLVAAALGVTGCGGGGGSVSGDDGSFQSPDGGGATDGIGTGGHGTGGTGGVTPGEGTTDGGTSGGDPSGGDPSGGDPSGGDPSGGDPSGGDPSGGDPSSGDPSGDPSGGGSADGGTPPPVTGRLTVNWRAPAERENGDPLPLAQLAGYRIYYGPVADPTANVISVGDPMLTLYVIDGLPGGTWEVAVSAVDGDGLEGQRSNPLSKTIP